MSGQMISNWVLWLQHNNKLMMWMFSLATICICLGLWNLQIVGNSHDLIILGISFLVMILVAGYLMMSVRSGMLMLLFSSFVLLSVLGVMGWLDIPLTFSGMNGMSLVVVVVMLISNLVYFLTGLHREMARGQFQHDAIVTALQLNLHPVILSNMTTAFSFLIAGFFEPEIMPMAWIVLWGAFFSIILSLTWFPLVLLNLFIECRVGESKDRHGLLPLAKWIQEHKKIRIAVIFIVVCLGIWSFYYLSVKTFDFIKIGWVVLGLTILLSIAWKNIKYAVINSLLTLYSVVVIAALISYLWNYTVSFWALMIPMGLIVDDGIHFFVRYLRAKTGFFQDSEQALRFTMASIGRPLWITSFVLLSGMIILTFSDYFLIRTESFIIILSLLLMTTFILIAVPACLNANIRK